jgi:hypothetical protein
MYYVGRMYGYWMLNFAVRVMTTVLCSGKSHRVSCVIKFYINTCII